MREIQTKKEIEKKETNRKTTLGIIMVLLMLLSTAGYALLNQSSNNTGSSSENQGNPNGQIVEFNGIKFIGQDNGLWKFEVTGAQSPFYSSYTPKEVEKIRVPTISLQELSQKPLYYSGNGLVFSEIYGNINPYVLRGQEACYQESGKNCTDDLPIKDCSNNFIIIRELNDESNETSKITREENCIFVNAKNSDILKSADALLFRILGIN